MTRGTLTNKKTGQTLTGDRQGADTQGWYFYIDGTTVNNYFYSRDWDFIEDKPSAYDQYLALKPGTRFTLVSDGQMRMKLDDSHYAKPFSKSWGDGWDTFPITPSWFGDDDEIEKVD